MPGIGSSVEFMVQNTNTSWTRAKSWLVLNFFHNNRPEIVGLVSKA